MADGDNPNIQVCVRIRPPHDPSEDFSEIFGFPPDRPNVISIKDPLSKGRSEHSYLFDRLFMPQDDQAKVFDAIARPMVDHLLHGCNSCCFAFGQTGSGKTYSIFGEGGDLDRGLLPRVIEYLFEKVEQVAGSKEVGMVVSLLEVYLDQIRDLGRAYMGRSMEMQPPGGGIRPFGGNGGGGGVRTGGNFGNRPQSATGSHTPAGNQSAALQFAAAGGAQNGGRRPSSAGGGGLGKGSVGPAGGSNAEAAKQAFETQDLEVREAPNGQIYVKDLTLVPVKNISEVLDVARYGLAARQTHETRMNPYSSRSHTVFTVNVVQKDRRVADSQAVSGLLNLVDLAGSERLAKSKAEGVRFQEAVTINSSLSALGKCVLALASPPGTQPSQQRHVPYRDSKLTRVLQSSLGGGSYISVLACLNPNSDNYEESLNTLSFADRCKNMNNRPAVSYEGATSPGGGGERKIRRLMAEIADLKHQLEISKTSFEQKVNFMNENLGTSGAPEALRALEGEVREDKKYEEGLQRAKVEARQRLKEEKERQAKAMEAAKEASKKAKVAQENLVQDAEDGGRELVALREYQRKLETDIERHHELMRSSVQGRTEEHTEQLWHAKTTSAGAIRSVDDRTVLQIPSQLAAGRQKADALEKEWQLRKASKERRHSNQVHRMRQDHEGEKANVEQQYKALLEQKEQDCQKFIRDFDAYDKKKRVECTKYQHEVQDLYDRVRALAKLVADMESGVYPTANQNGVRRVMLPPGTKPKPPHDEDFQLLFKSLQAARRSAMRYERAMNRLPLGQTPEDGGEDGADMEDQRYVQDDRLEPAELAWELLGDEDNENAVQRLRRQADEDRLRSLCKALKTEALKSFDVREERKRVRDEVHREIEDGSTLEYMRYLEQEAARARDAYKEEVEVSKRLRIYLESSKSRPSSAVSATPSASAMNRAHSAGPAQTRGVSAASSATARRKA